MEINLRRVKGEIAGYIVKNNAKRGEVRRYMIVKVGRDLGQLNATIGDDMAGKIFAGFHDGKDPTDGGNADGFWVLKSPRPSGKVICPEHKITVNGEVYNGEPKVPEFQPVDKTLKVIMLIHLPLGKAQKGLRRLADDQAGNLIDISMTPSKMPLPGVDDDKKKGQLSIVKGAPKK